VSRVIKTFFLGLVLGAIGAGTLMWKMPAVDLHRESSLVTVQPNGGNVEEFRINLPRDRIMVGLPDPNSSIPAALDWPGQVLLGDMQAELFKIRDRNDTVIGVGSRIASASEASGPFIEWALHFPARGTMYVKLEMTPSEDGVRNGLLMSGTREFAKLSGGLREEFVAAAPDDEESQGRIRLNAMLVGPLGESE